MSEGMCVIDVGARGNVIFSQLHPHFLNKRTGVWFYSTHDSGQLGKKTMGYISPKMAT